MIKHIPSFGEHVSFKSLTKSTGFLENFWWRMTKDNSKSFSGYREAPSPESPSSSLAIILGLICFEPEVKLLELAAVSGMSWSQCCCALYARLPWLNCILYCELNYWFSVACFFLWKTVFVYKERLSWSGGICNSCTPLAATWSREDCLLVMVSRVRLG